VYRTKDGRIISIRRAVPRDFDSYLKVWQRVADEKKYIPIEQISRQQQAWWRRSVGESSLLLAAADVRGEIVGALTLARYDESPKTEHVRNLGIAVASGFRSVGIGSALMD
jgi:GNAT superfamily N-acetyltransferase